MKFELTYRQYSERSILVEWPVEIHQNTLQDILIFKQNILKLSIKSIVQVNNAYNSILIIYDTAIDNIYSEILMLKRVYSERKQLQQIPSRLFTIPVCYDAEFGIDLLTISKVKNLSISEIISLHSEVDYTVFFVGFLPGFLYLGGLDVRLVTPRLKSPRLQIEKGAVAIGGSQTGIYPNASPGGWNIIGNSPINFFNPNLEDPCFAKAGDKIKFLPVNKKTYNDILDDVHDGIYQIENKKIDG